MTQNDGGLGFRNANLIGVSGVAIRLTSQ